MLFVFFSCNTQSHTYNFPVPDSGISPNEKPVIIEIGNILETKNGAANQMPPWLWAFLGSGIGLSKNWKVTITNMFL